MDAVKSASPYPEVPADLMAMRPGSTGVSISVRFLYVVTPTTDARIGGAAP